MTESFIPANVKHLVARAELLKTARSYFDQRGFYEVQPPCLARDCVVDAYLDPLTVDTAELKLAATDLPPRMFLQTSPESVMKRMLASGAPSIYSLGPVFRSGESGRYHNVEFTMLEWYEVGGDADSAIELLGRFVSHVLGATGFDRMTYRQCFQQHLGIDPISEPIAGLKRLLLDADAELAETLADDRDTLLDVLLSSRLVSKMGLTNPLVVTDYPLSQAALAKRSPSDPDCASRFELFYQGVELANGYDELCDAEILHQRFQRENDRRRRSGRERLTSDTTLLRAMQQGLPDCAGVALGFDRLLMCLLGIDHIDQVIPFAIERA